MRNSILSIVSAVCLTTLSAGAVSPYIAKVYEYCPAPGQFINTLPKYDEGDTYGTMLEKAGEQLTGDRTPGLISLGAFGGYVIFGFDHSVINVPGEYDFKVYGNAILSNASTGAGSSEPGIVMVSSDDNGNGLPDDEWYELAGSEYNNESTIKNYGITYYAPAEDHVADPDPDNRYITDRSYIAWIADKGDVTQGYVMKNSSHQQSYWPGWVSQTTQTFAGTKLADNYVDTSGNGTYFVQMALDWGYVDNLPNAQDSGFKIDWAVDAAGTPVLLDKIDFIRVHTAVNQYCGWLGETSTEVAGAEDLHPDYVSVGEIHADNEVLLLSGTTHNSITVRSSAALPFTVYNTSGARMLQGALLVGETQIDTAALPEGIYILHTGKQSIKFVQK